jgi:hypothetical protein
MEKKLPDTLIDLCQDWQGAPIRLMFWVFRSIVTGHSGLS